MTSPVLRTTTENYPGSQHCVCVCVCVYRQLLENGVDLLLDASSCLAWHWAHSRDFINVVCSLGGWYQTRHWEQLFILRYSILSLRRINEGKRCSPMEGHGDWEGTQSIGKLGVGREDQTTMHSTKKGWDTSETASWTEYTLWQKQEQEEGLLTPRPLPRPLQGPLLSPGSAWMPGTIWSNSLSQLHTDQHTQTQQAFVYLKKERVYSVTLRGTT